MATTTVRLGQRAHCALRTLSAQTGEPMAVVLERAIEAYRRQRVLEESNAAYAALRADPEAWAYELAERELWAATLGDSLEPQGGGGP